MFVIINFHHVQISWKEFCFRGFKWTGHYFCFGFSSDGNKDPVT